VAASGYVPQTKYNVQITNENKTNVRTIIKSDIEMIDVLGSSS
jgi:hypothetical protein